MDFDDDRDVFQQTVIHLRLKQWRNRRFYTIIEGIPPIFDQKKMLRYWKKQYSTSGYFTYDDKDKEKIKQINVAGDFREEIRLFLQDMGIASKQNIKIHGT